MLDRIKVGRFNDTKFKLWKLKMRDLLDCNECITNNVSCFLGFHAHNDLELLFGDI